MQPREVQSKRVEYSLNGESFIVTDYSINKRYNEDELYLQDEVWQNYPRGKATVEIDGEVVYTLSGLQKYGTCDEGYGNKDWKLQAQKVYATVKENGECFHLGMFSYQGITYALVGSKNVHILVDTCQPINSQLKYELSRQSTRVSYACEMAQLYFDTYHSKAVSEYLTSSWFTLVGESINPAHEHVVVYDERCIRFFALTHFDSLYTAIPFGECLNILNSLNLPTVVYRECKLDELEQLQATYYDSQNCEGLVLYYTDSEDKVVMMHKFKAKQYTVLRTIRELYKAGLGVHKLQSRLQQYHLPLTEEEIDKYCHFMNWLQRTQPTGCFSTKLWDAFISDTSVDESEKYSTAKLIVLTGLPGVGKTTVGGSVAWLMNVDGVRAEYIDQDMFNGNKKMFLKHLSTLLHPRSGCKYVIVGRCNATVEARKECLDFAPTDNVLVHFETSEEQVKELVNRINQRQFHATLKPSNRVLNVIRMFQGKWQPVQPDEANLIISLNHNLTFEEKVKMVFKGLQLPEPVEIVQFQWCKFIGLKVDLQDLKDLIDSDEDVGKHEYKVKCVDPHVTLLHHTSFHQYPQLALKLQQFIRLGKTSYEIEVYSFKYNDRISAFNVGFENHVLRHSLPHIRPHITYDKQAKVDATESIPLLRDEHAKTRYFNRRVELKCTLQLW